MANFCDKTHTAGIRSNQTGIHENLERLLRRHQQTEFQKPFAAHSLAAFAEAEKIIAATGMPLILDSGCGVGESTVMLAAKFPDHLVLGIDKSRARLAKNHAYAGEAVPHNFILIRADLFDFWRLAAHSHWQVARHYLLYPNPWPKKQALKKRYHGHPAFGDLIKLGEALELRSNWRIYVEEFAHAYSFHTGRVGRVERFVPQFPLTPFERKYLQRGHELYRFLG